MSAAAASNSLELLNGADSSKLLVVFVHLQRRLISIGLQSLPGVQDLERVRSLFLSFSALIAEAV